MAQYSLGIDIGGTFTDLVVYDHEGGSRFSRKVLTTHDDPARAVAAGVAGLLTQARVDPATVRERDHDAQRTDLQHLGRAEVGRPGELRHRRLSPLRDRDPERESRLTCPLDPRIALTEVDAAAELERGVDVVVDDELGIEGGGERLVAKPYIRVRRADA